MHLPPVEKGKAKDFNLMMSINIANTDRMCIVWTPQDFM